MFLMSSSLMNFFAQEDGGKQLRNSRKNPLIKTRIGISPVIGLYKTNKNHTSGTKQKMSFCFSVKEELRFNNKNKDFLFFGVDYMMHGVSFNSYYFYADSIKLYNGKMNYQYGLTMHEIDFPIQFKHSFQKETNSIISSYLFGGYCYRWMVASNLKVEKSGEEVVNKSENVTFKLPAFTTKNSSFLSIGLGVQKNTPFKYKAIFAELQVKYGLSPFYFNEPFSPNSLYTNNHFIYLTVGFKL